MISMSNNQEEITALDMYPCNFGNLNHIKPTLTDFPEGSYGKEFTYDAGDLGSILGLGSSPG